MTTNAFAGLGSKLYLQQLNPATIPSARSISAITKPTQLSLLVQPMV